jgi:cephalosporin hydroxylase
MINELTYRIHNRLLRYKVLAKPIMSFEESMRALAFRLNKDNREKLAQHYSSLASFESVFQFACDVLGPHQKRSEIERLIEFAQARNPKTALEIGMAEAGTTFLLKERISSLNLLMGVDIHLHNVFILEAFNRRGCHLRFFEGDSSSQQIKKGVVDSLAGRKLDLLFIDGDHSYEGVKSDFENYKALVSEGGMIIFHDICEDFNKRYGVFSVNYAGGVPQFWQEIKGSYEHHEFVDNPDQDGFGIGCLIFKN